MTAQLISGKGLSRAIRSEVAREIVSLPRVPGLATVLVGDDPASAVYVASKRRQCVQVGMREVHRHLPGDVSQARLEAVVEELALDREVDGILVQLPLPGHLDARRVLSKIPPDKDVDGLTEVSAGRLTLGLPGLRPCTPLGIMALLHQTQPSLAGLEVVVVGRSELVGKPVAQLLLARHATVTQCHSRTADLDATCRRADVLVVAAGVPGLVGADAVKPGAVVIDVGIHRTPDGLCGDVRHEEVAEVASALTPVPGGVGPMTIAMLLRNTVLAARLADPHSPRGTGWDSSASRGLAWVGGS